MKNLVLLLCTFSIQAMELPKYPDSSSENPEDFISILGDQLEEISKQLDILSPKYSERHYAFEHYKPSDVQRYTEILSLATIGAGTIKSADEKRKRIPFLNSTGLYMALGGFGVYIVNIAWEQVEKWVLKGALDKVTTRLQQVEKEFKILQEQFEQVRQNQELISEKVHGADEKLAKLIPAVHERLRLLHQQFPTLPEPKKDSEEKKEKKHHWWSSKK